MFLFPTSAAPRAVGPALLFLSGYVLAAAGVGQTGSSASSASALFPSTFGASASKGDPAGAESPLETLQASIPDFVTEVAASPSIDSHDQSQVARASPSSSSASPVSGATAPVATSEAAGFSEEEPTVKASLVRSNDISKHQSEDGHDASEGSPVSMVQEDQDATPASSGNGFYVWNPLEASETNESDELRNEGTPEDFVGIPLLDDVEASRGNTTVASAAATAVSSSDYTSRWQREAPVSRTRTPIEDSRWTRKPKETDSGTKTPNSNTGGQNRYISAPDTSNGGSTSRRSPLSNPSYSRGYLPSPLFPSRGNTQTQPQTEEDEDITENKQNCEMVVAGVRIDTTYVDAECTGDINVYYRGASGSFSPRRMRVTNTTNKGVTVVFKTVDAKVSIEPTYERGQYSFLQGEGPYGPASFLQGVSEEEGQKATADYVQEMLKEMRKHLRKYPNTPLDLTVSFQSPLDNPESAGGVTSFMQTQEGSDRILGTCEELMSALKERTNYTCEVLEAIDMVILQFPPTADLSDGGQIDNLLTKLLTLEGKNILFWELSKQASVQMVPVDKDLPEPVTPLAESPAFVQAKEHLKQQCSAEATARSHLLAGEVDSPVAARMPKDPDLENKLWGLYAARCVQAWLHGEMGHSDVVVAVVDSGVSNHYDLDANAWRNKSELLDGRDNDGNGFVDDTYGWNFHTGTRIISDGNGHGTHVAGTIGGVSNSYGIVGCAPKVSIMKVQHFGPSGSGSIGDGVRAVAYALMNGADVINNSWGSPDTTQTLQLIFERARQMRGGLGVLLVNAAGNDNSNNDYRPVYPANFDYEHTICVGSYSSDGQRSSFSNYGRRMVTLFAPGDRIYSTYPGGQHTFLSGTSMATPHVSGVAALVFGVFKKANSQVSAAEVKDIIMATLQRLPSVVGLSQTGGAVDAMAAVLMARMGGMWCQMHCSDMIVDLGPGEVHVPTLFVRGYQKGLYSGNIQAEVYDSSGRLLGTGKVPFRLKSSSAPDTNYPSDAVAATAFAQDKKSTTSTNALCEVQVKYAGALGTNTPPEDAGMSKMQIAAIVLCCVAGVLLVAIVGVVVYFYLKKRKQQPQGPRKKEADSAAEQGKKEADADTVDVEESPTAEEESKLLEGSA